MMNALRRVLAGIVTLALASPVSALAQSAPPPTAVLATDQSAPAFTQQQLDQILAPIALYPDPLLTSILTAATYPLEVVQAARWIADRHHAQLKGDALTAAVANQSWDPSVKSLLPFPQVLKMLDSRLDWMQQLGDAFLSQEAAVMASVQRLRQEAEAAGKLQSTPQQSVSNEDGAIVIVPANPDMIYVPAYNPNVIYGSWPYPDYPPIYVPWWSDYNYGLAPGPGIVFGGGIALIGSPYLWGNFDWHRRHVRVDPALFNRLAGARGQGAGSQFTGDVWQHDPAHRRGVAYRDVQTRERFQPGAAAIGNPAQRRDFRGFTPPQQPTTTPSNVRPNFVPNNVTGNQRPAIVPAPSAVPPANSGVQRFAVPHNPPPALTQRPAIASAPSAPRFTPPTNPGAQRFAAPHNPPPAFSGFGRGADVRVQSARGAASLHTVAPPPRAAPVQALRAPAPPPRAPAPPPVARGPAPPPPAARAPTPPPQVHH